MNRLETSLPDGRRLTLYWTEEDGGPSSSLAPAGPPGPVLAARAHGERRWDPTRQEWVTLATHRQERTYKPPADSCPLCPSHPGKPLTDIPFERFEVGVFDNRFPSFVPDAGAPPEATVPREDGLAGLLQRAPASGRCEVVVYSDDHEATFSDLPLARVRLLVDVWADRTAVLGKEAAVRYVMPFENKGELVGTTLSHPHGQIYAYPMVPPRPREELGAAGRYRDRTGRCIWCDTVEAESRGAKRIVHADEVSLAFVPFWARLPYQVEVAAREHRPSLLSLEDAERDGLADTMLRTARAYDALWGFSLPYVMAFSQQPAKGFEEREPLGHLRVTFMPFHRDAGRTKYLAGSELAAGAFLNDVAPEEAAARLRAAASASTVG